MYLKEELSVDQVKSYWETNAHTWTKLTRQGCDRSRDLYNTPTFLSNLPDIRGLNGIDIGCGEGHNTRKLAELGANLVGIDICSTFIDYARTWPHGNERVSYHEASAHSLPFPDETFDFATSFMAFMDMPRQEAALEEIYRVLKPNGFFKFSISHPCFATPRREWVYRDGKKDALTVASYFDNENATYVDKWMFRAAKSGSQHTDIIPEFAIPTFHRTLSWWFSAFMASGFKLIGIDEPVASAAVIKTNPKLADTKIVPEFLHFTLQK